MSLRCNTTRTCRCLISPCFPEPTPFFKGRRLAPQPAPRAGPAGPWSAARTRGGSASRSGPCAENKTFNAAQLHEVPVAASDRRQGPLASRDLLMTERPPHSLPSGASLQHAATAYEAMHHPVSQLRHASGGFSDSLLELTDHLFG